MAFGLSTELWVILAVVLVLFGAAAIPKLARSLGRAESEFKKARKEFDKERKKGAEEGDAGGDEEAD